MSPVRAQERRRSSRLSCDIALTGKVGSQQAQVIALDLSATGARVVLPRQWARSREVALTGQGSTVRARVIWVDGQADGTVLAGLHFVEDQHRLASTWAHLHLRRHGKGLLRRQATVPCELKVGVRYPGRSGYVPLTLTSLSASGAQLEGSLYLPLGAQLRLEIPYEDGRKHLRLVAEILQQRRHGDRWRTTLQFLLAEEARERAVLERMLRDLRSA